jgi:ABC-type maltose transport system permease subunit
MKTKIDAHSFTTGEDMKAVLEIERGQDAEIYCNVTFDDTTIGIDVDDKLLNKIYQELYKRHGVRFYDKWYKELWWWIRENSFYIAGITFYIILLLTIMWAYSLSG